jgi:predicted ATP-dependent endonuclease of OLD family
MKLIKLRIENYKCIEDTTEFQVDQVTCSMGKNEAGKTAILEALYKLNPVEKEKGEFEELEYPRRYITNYRQRQDQEQANVLTTVWELNPEELSKLHEKFGSEIVLRPEVIVKKGYDNNLKWNISLDEKKYVSNLKSTYKLDAAERAQLQKADSIKSLIENLEGLESPTDKQKELLSNLIKLFPDKTESKLVGDLLENHLPRFVYFDTYYKLPGRVALTDLKERVNNNQLNFGDKIFLALLDMTSSGLEDVETIGESEKLIMELEAIENSLTDQIFEYWTQNDHLSVKFLFDVARPNDPPPYNRGFVFNTRISNNRHRASVNFDERSTGFIWFFSFLVWFSQVRKNYGDNLFLLLDEPGLSLHGKAQKDLLRYINEKLRPNFQVIYTAHSPFMIDLEHIFSIRTVEDMVEVSKVDGISTMKVLGTKVGNRILSRDRDTLFPLQGILGFDMAQTLFVGPYVVVVEGPTEFGYLHWFSRRLVSLGREGLDIRWAICPSEGASKVSSFVTLFRGRGLTIAVLLDYHDGQKTMVDQLEGSHLLEPGHLLRTTSYLDQDEADIEDLVGWDMYINLVNNALKLPDHLKLPQQKPQNANKRAVKEVEAQCRMLPPGFPEFDHYLPVGYLMELSPKEIVALPGLENALNRFEKLFHDLNTLI